MSDDKTALLDRLSKMRDKRDYHMRENKRLRDRVRHQTEQIAGLEAKVARLEANNSGEHHATRADE